MGIERLANLCGFAAKHLLIHWQYSLAMLLPLALALAVMSSMTFIRDGLRGDAQLSTAFLPDVTVEMLSAGRATHVPAGMAEKIQHLTNIARVVPRIWGILPIQANGQDNAYTLLGIDPARMPIPPAIRFALKSGRFLRPDDRGCLVLGETVARSLHAHTGDVLAIRTPAGEIYHFHVIGIFTSAVQIYAADLLLTHLEDARDFFGYAPGEAADLCVYVQGGAAHADYAAATIAKAFPTSRVLTREKLARVLEQSYGARSGIFQLLWLMLLVNIMLLVWSHASGAALFFKKEVGILKALGWSLPDILQARLIATALLSLFACLVGLWLGLFYVYLGAPGIREYFLGWTAIYPKFTLPLHISIESIATLLALGTVPMLAAALVPAWVAAVQEAG